MHKGFLITATLLGALTVAIGAFGAHALKALVPENILAVYDTAVRYQFYHLLALALTGILYAPYKNNWLKYAGGCFIIGIILFSGSLYLLTIKAVIGSEGFGWAGPLTPLGGLFFISGWLQLAWGIKKG
jgi:uncharacterized membrane protein YgdD (TMEM256/DUF423 family)